MKSVQIISLMLFLVLFVSCGVSTDIERTKWQEREVCIYYVKDDQIHVEKQVLPNDVETITEYWLQKNAFPEDCRLEHHWLTLDSKEIDFSAYYRIDILDEEGVPSLYLFFLKSAKDYFEQSNELYKQAYIDTMLEYIKVPGILESSN